MSRSRRGPWILWTSVLVVGTAVMLAVRADLDKAHVALLYLLLVLAGSVAGGRPLGIVLAGASFVAFNWFFLEPYGTLVISNPLDWLVLIAFLIVALVAAQIVHRLQDEAEEARRRTEEVDRLAALGARTLALPRAGEALDAVAETIRVTLDLSSCRIFRSDQLEEADDLVVWVARHGRAAGRHSDGTSHLSASASPDVQLEQACALFLPLLVQDRIVGVLEIVRGEPIGLDQSRGRFLAVLSYYAALGVERVRLESEAAAATALREVDRAKDAILASVSHDLRTPLTTIKALATEMASKGDDRALTISEEADRLNRLVADLLDLSRLRANAFPIRIELNAADELVEAVLQRVRGVIGTRPVQVSMADGGTLLVGRFDLGQSIRILVNLIENAAKYSPASSPIDLTVTTAADRLHFEVSDRGPGVAEAIRERIFEAFYRQPGRTPDTGGTGLGLAIARSLAQAQGGTLTYHPRPEGGSTFRLTLPAARLEGLEESL